jgi:hypothetical protein
MTNIKIQNTKTISVGAQRAVPAMITASISYRGHGTPCPYGILSFVILFQYVTDLYCAIV